MKLVLQVTNQPSRPIAGESQRVFDSAGGSIGRTEDNDWVLPAPGVSRVHARVRFQDGRYLIEDCSKNGMMYNGRDLPRGESVPLKTGDQLIIDVFEIGVALTAARVEAPPPRGITTAEEEQEGTIDSSRTPTPPWRQPAPPPPYFDPDATAEGDEMPQQRPEPLRGGKTQLAPAFVDGVLAEVLNGAGLSSREAIPGAADVIGQVLRVVVTGLMEVLRKRTEIKAQFGLSQTMIQQAENNPLKFAPSPEDALKVLFVRPNAAYLPAVEAFEDALEEVRAHQLATVAGMRAAFVNMLTEIKPERLLETFEDQMKRGPFVAMPGKGKYWDYYQSLYAGWVKNSDASFSQLFGDEFNRVYDEQLRQLRADSARRRGRGG